MRVLVANRGEIALRILHTLRLMRVASVAVYTDADAEAPHVFAADVAVHLGGDAAYLDGAALLAAARAAGATALHPGYGFLSQSPAFAAACGAAGLVFIGPAPDAMAMLGDKGAARELAARLGIPVLPGAARCADAAAAAAAAAAVGYPVLLKAAAGGGGKGMRRVADAAALPGAFAAATREARGSSGDGRLLLERWLAPARHIEVQVLGDGHAAVVLGERDCSLQRRFQKVVEEGPAPALAPATRAALHADAARLVVAAGYSGAGTVEFLLGEDGRHAFLEVNPRLQVEHAVTEMLTGLDLVAAQVALAHGGALPAAPAVRGHAIEARLNAEDPSRGFLPASGEVLALHWPHLPHLRVDAGIVRGQRVTPRYDSLLAKLIAWGPDREAARRTLVAALEQSVVLGVVTNQRFLLDLVDGPAFARGAMSTTSLEAWDWSPPPPPAWVPAAVAAASAASAGSPSAAAASPWETLTDFELGRCG